MFKDFIRNGQKVLAKVQLKDREYQRSDDLRTLNKIISFV
jgi:hypothetical protein